LIGFHSHGFYNLFESWMTVVIKKSGIENLNQRIMLHEFAHHRPQ